MTSAHQQYSSIEALPLVLRVEEVMSVLGIGRNSVYAMIHSGQIRSIRVGRQIRVPKDALEELLSGTVA